MSKVGIHETIAHLNRIATAVPEHDAHGEFLEFAQHSLGSERERALFRRMARQAQIDHRYSVLSSDECFAGGAVRSGRFYVYGRFPTTAERMRVFEKHAAALAVSAIEKLQLGARLARITHLIVTSCTGMMAPGIDLEIVAQCGLSSSVERTCIGFMGCYAGVIALKFAHHIVRSEPSARVLIVNLELCSLHLQETSDIEQLLSLMVFADGCSASVVSADPVGFAIDGFHAAVIPDTSSLITWHVGDSGFNMFLSGRVPASISLGLADYRDAILNGATPSSIDMWAVHPGGRSVLDAVAKSLQLNSDALAVSRGVLKDYGNMSSATVMFVLESLLKTARAGERGCGMSFGPGLTAETFLFHKAADQ